MTMRALSLSRPWPWAILHAGKRIENRQRRDGRMPSMCKHRGPLLLHAAKSWDGTAQDWMNERGLLRGPTGGYPCDRSEHPAGVIFARCRVVGHVRSERCDRCDGSGVGATWLGKSHGCGSCGGRGALPVPCLDHDGDEVDWDLLGGVDLRWWMGGYALVLADVEPTPLIECKGALGLWRPPAEVVERLEAR